MIEHAFKAAPFYPNRCDVRVEDGFGRRTQCAAPPSEHREAQTGFPVHIKADGSGVWPAAEHAPEHAVEDAIRKMREARWADERRRLRAWIVRTFGESMMMDRWERTARIVEEALELAQAEDVTELDATRIIRRVYGRPVGEVRQEAAGVGVCLIAYADAAGIDLDAAIRDEIERVEKVPVEKIRAKQAEKVAAGTGKGIDPQAYRCSGCGATRMLLVDGTLGACSFLECRDPMVDYRREHPDAEIVPCVKA